MAKTQENNKKYYNYEDCSDFKDFLSKVEGKINHGWVFRGHQDDSWELQHRFERACTRLNVFGQDRIRVENNIIREFKRRVHHYTANVPKETDEWLSLMQHHGAPTRFLDCTYSPYVAAYFAFQSAEANKIVAIWAVNFQWFIDQLKDIDQGIYQKYTTYQKSREEHGEYFDDIFINNPMKFLVSVNPFRLNERLAYQRGIFLCPGDVSASLEENLSVYNKTAKLAESIIQYKIPTGSNNENTIKALEVLDSMNISSITLFPGLDGFAQSLENRIKSLFETQYFD